MERESTIVGVEEGDWIWRSEARVFNENAKLGFKQVKRGGVYIERIGIGENLGFFRVLELRACYQFGLGLIVIHVMLPKRQHH